MTLDVSVVKAVRAPVAPAFLRAVLDGAAAVPAVRTALRRSGEEPGLTVRVSGDRELRRLNRRFLGEDHATDVLSFPSGDEGGSRRRALPGAALRGGVPPLDEGGALRGGVLPFEQTGYLGDLALSWPAVLRQAAAFGHPPEVEAALLVVHGLLHLLGWDHASPEDEREMTRLTLACLARSGLRPAPGRLPGLG